MRFTASWFRGDEIICSEHAPTFSTARDIAKSKLAAYKVRSGATHAEVRSDDHVLLFDSRCDMTQPPRDRPRMAGNLIKRLSFAH